MSLETIRRQIDDIDDAILALLIRRMELALETRSLKQNTEDKTRETEIINRIRAIAAGSLDPDFCEQVYRLIISESKRLQQL